MVQIALYWTQGKTLVAFVNITDEQQKNYTWN